MERITCFANCLDASILVKVYADEANSPAVREYVWNQPTRFTTPFCYFEAMSVLKGKRKRGDIDDAAYHKAALGLTADVEAWNRSLKHPDLFSPEIFFKVQDMCKRHPEIDYSDALLVFSVQFGPYSALCDGSQTVLVTADRDLAKVAELMGLRCRLF